MTALEAAVAYAARGWSVVPCRGKAATLARNAQGEGGARAASADAETIRRWFTRWPDANVGIVAGPSGLLVLDVDTKGGDGHAELLVLEDELGPLPPTYTVRTPSGGAHYYFAAPRGVQITASTRTLAPHIDIRAGWTYVVAPPSAGYEIAVDVEPAELPAAWIERLRAPERVARPEPPRIDTRCPDHDQIVRRAVAYLERMPPAISGRGGHDATFRAAIALARGFGLSEEETFRLLRDHYNPRCRPPWSERELRHKARSATEARVPMGYLLEGDAERAEARAIYLDDAPPPSDDDAPPPDDSDAPPGVRRVGPEPATTYTDLGNAERYAEQHGADVRYCGTLGGWYTWDGARWARDETLEVQRRAHETARRLYVEVEAIARELSRERNEERRAALAAMLEAAKAHAKKSEHASRLAAMLHEARAIPPIPVAWEAFDGEATALLLNTPSGTVDLERGTVRPHRREDLITRCTGVPYDPNATAPRFAAFLERILPDPGVRGFMRRWAGYAATGVIREHILPIWYGTGANGKSTLAELLSRVLGDYSVRAPAGFFEEQKYRKHETEIARLRGARLSIVSETERAAHLAEAKVKDLTGGEELTGRFMRCDFFTFRPTCKFALLTNHKPRIRSTDDGIRRRIVLVPFEVTIPPEERDLGLIDALIRDEAPGILRWIVDGARELAANDWRLDPPESIRAATREYLASEDTVGRFLEEACTVRPPGDRAVRSQPSHLFQAYQSWCAANAEAACDARDFAGRLRARGYEADKGSKGVRWYYGIAPHAEQPDDRRCGVWGEP